MLRLAWPADVSTINCACFAYALRASDERTEPEAESKADAVDSKRAYESTSENNKMSPGLNEPKDAPTFFFLGIN